jgi:hypothetical protein
MSSLENVFNEVEEAATTEETAPEPEAAEESQEVAEETTETGDKPEEDSTPEPETTPEQKTVPISALMDERSKRQALQRQVDEAAAQKSNEPAPDVFEDQKGYTDHITQQMNNALFNERANMSEFYARRDHPDLDEKIEKYQQLKLDNPALGTQVQNATSPYHEVVDIVDKHEKMQRMENIDEFEAKTRTEIEAKVRAEVEAELKGKSEAKDNLKSSIPTSLVGEASKGSVKGAEYTGPTKLTSIFND